MTTLRLRLLQSLVLLTPMASAQQILWEILPTPTSGYSPTIHPFTDFNRDGYRDLIAVKAYDYLTPQYRLTLDILSGRDGSVLVTEPLGAQTRPDIAGDHDGDGFDEYGYTTQAAYFLYSPRRQQVIQTIPGLSGGEFGSAAEPNIDLDGDGQLDFLLASVRAFDSTLFALDHSGTLLYSIPASVHGWVIRSIGAYVDLDGDGGTDYLVGAIDPTGAGSVSVLSGRTGGLLRYHAGLQPGDLLGKPVMRTGDLDGDGVPDYAGSSAGNFGQRHVTIVWSGATGAVLRQWVDPNFGLGAIASGDLDFDLDGHPDVWMWWGVHSMRDGYRFFDTSFASIHLGVQPDSPYPVLAGSMQVSTGVPYGVLRAYRCQPADTALLGSDCASPGSPPTIGVRRQPAGTRVQVGSAPPGALAWCVFGDGLATTTSGQPLPIALDPIGFGGCALQVPLDFVGATVVGSAGIDRGFAAFDLPQALVGRGGGRFAAQWLVLDPVTGAFATTKRHEMLLQ